MSTELAATQNRAHGYRQNLMKSCSAHCQCAGRPNHPAFDKAIQNDLRAAIIRDPVESISPKTQNPA